MKLLAAFLIGVWCVWVVAASGADTDTDTDAGAALSAAHESSNAGAVGAATAATTAEVAAKPKSKGKGKSAPKKLKAKTAEKKKKIVLDPQIVNPWGLKPTFSIFKCDALIDAVQITRCMECFQKGSPAPWEVVGYYPSNQQCFVGHEIVPLVAIERESDAKSAFAPHATTGTATDATAAPTPGALLEVVSAAEEGEESSEDESDSETDIDSSDDSDDSDDSSEDSEESDESDETSAEAEVESDDGSGEDESFTDERINREEQLFAFLEMASADLTAKLNAFRSTAQQSAQSQQQ